MKIGSKATLKKKKEKKNKKRKTLRDPRARKEDQGIQWPLFLNIYFSTVIGLFI